MRFCLSCRRRGIADFVSKEARAEVVEYTRVDSAFGLLALEILNLAIFFYTTNIRPKHSSC
jgi:tRNA(Ser,Leu) C12 N-acetylase TAN1